MATTPPSLFILPPNDAPRGGINGRNEPLFQPNIGPFRPSPVTPATSSFVRTTNIVPILPKIIEDPYKYNRYSSTGPADAITPIGSDIQSPPYSYNGPPKAIPVYKNLRDYLKQNAASPTAPIVNAVNISTLPDIPQPTVGTLNRTSEVRVKEIAQQSISILPPVINGENVRSKLTNLPKLPPPTVNILNAPSEFLSEDRVKEIAQQSISILPPVISGENVRSKLTNLPKLPPPTVNILNAPSEFLSEDRVKEIAQLPEGKLSPIINRSKLTKLPDTPPPTVDPLNRTSEVRVKEIAQLPEGKLSPIINGEEVRSKLTKLPELPSPTVSVLNKESEIRLEEIQQTEDPNSESVNESVSKPNTDVSLVSKFFKNLGTWEGSIPLQHLWVVKFYFTNSFKTNFNSWFDKIISQGENLPWSQFDMGNINDIINDNSLQGENLASSDIITGCYFARSVSLPGERTDMINPSIPGAGGLFFNNVLNKRQAPANLQVSFMETNASFVDLFIRPWSILSSYTGSVGRVDNLKVDVEAIFYSKNNIVNYNKPAANNARPIVFKKPIILDSHEEIQVVPRKRFYFKSVLPVSTNSQEYTQTGESLQIRPVDFMYDSYKVSTYM